MFTLRTYTKKFAWPFWYWYLGGTIALAATNIISLEIPQLAKQIVNAVGEKADKSELSTIALWIVALGMLTIFIRALSRVLIFFPGRKIETNTKSFLFAKLLRSPQAFFDRFGLGDLISRLANDVSQLRAFYAFGLLQVLNLAFLLAFTISKMISIHPVLTFVCLLPLFLMIAIIKPMMAYMHKISLLNQESLGRLTNKVTEAFVNVHVVKANASESVFAQRTEKENEEVYTTNMQAVLARTVLFPLMNMLMNVSQVLILLYGSYEILQGKLTIGDILAFNVYIAYLGFPLSAMGIVISLYQRCATALIRISEISDGELEAGRGEALRVDAHRDEHAPILSIKNLKFAYTPGRVVLDIPALEILPGEHVGLMGVIGSGKSTLFSLITRIYDPPRGTIFLYGQDICDLHPKVIRAKVGFAQQAVHLFSATVRENLQFGLAEQLSMRELEQAASDAQVLEDIESFSLKWDSPVGEKGIRLSGGQKQRLALARLLLRKTEILLLDDVLSAVDQKTEKNIIATISRTQKTTLIAGHRLSAIKHCSKIIIFAEGKIIAQGTFSELKHQLRGHLEEPHDTAS